MQYSKEIGIDLGTTKTCVGYFNKDRVQIIPNDQGNRTTPAFVSFNGDEILIGDPALGIAGKNALNTIYNVKRLMGRRFSDSQYNQGFKNWPFRIQCDNDGKTQVVVKYKGQVKQFYPEQITAMILQKIKERAYLHFGQTVRNAVISVPAYFNQSQKLATRQAAKRAGFNVLRLINEPNAAALAFEFDREWEGQQYVMIVDFGGGKLDVTLFVNDEGVIQTKATAGDVNLGGEDIDERLLKYCCEQFLKNKKIDISQNQRALRRLRNQCQKAKRILSSSQQTTIQVDSLAEEEDFYMTISRSTLEELCAGLFNEITPCIEKVLRDSGYSKNQISYVIPMGGSSRIPKVRQILSDFFNGKELYKGINPDESVACGAAMLAAILSRNSSQKLEKMLFINATPFSLGVQSSNGQLQVIVPRNCNIPTKKTQTFTTCQDNQSKMLIKIFQGERIKAKNNQLLAAFVLDNIQPAQKGVPKIQISIEIDENENICIIATNKQTEKRTKFSVSTDKIMFTEKEMDEMTLSAGLERFLDQYQRKKLNAKNQLKRSCQNVKLSAQSLIKKADEIQAWIQTHPHADITKIKEKQKQLEQTFKQIMQKGYKGG